jgi:hypothetical protein
VTMPGSGSSVSGPTGSAVPMPWHYMNIADGLAIERYRSPPEGDVLEAIERFRAALSNRSLPRSERAEALRFLVHFVVDIHQPLHVGRADDRGGNTIDVRLRGERMNLHRVWDSGAFDRSSAPLADYARALADSIDESDTMRRESASIDPRRWAAESLALRETVYDFDRRSGELPDRYLDALERVTRERLTLAAARLAAMLNDAFCR